MTCRVGRLSTSSPVAATSLQSTTPVCQASSHSSPTNVPSRWEDNRVSCHFFRLPAELRLAVYELVLGHHTIYIQHGGYSYRAHKVNGKRQLESIPLSGYHCTRYPPDCNPFLMRYSNAMRDAHRGLQLLNDISRDFYKDTSVLPYKWSTWAFQSHELMYRFLVEENRVPPVNLKAINTVFGQNLIVSKKWPPRIANREEEIRNLYVKRFPGLKVLWLDEPHSVTRQDMVQGGKESFEKLECDSWWQRSYGNPPYDFL